MADSTKNNGPICWATGTLGDFLLKLYHKRIVQPTNWLIEKRQLEYEFEIYLNSSVAKESSLGTKLHQNYPGIGIENLLLNVAKFAHKTDNNFLLKIDSNLLLQFRAKKLKYYHDQQCILENNDKQKTVQQINASEPIVTLVYKGRRDQQRIMFEHNSTACYICQLNFNGAQDFQHHMSTHTEMTNFMELNSNFNINEKQQLNVSYHKCSITEICHFYVEAVQPNIVVEKIMLIFSNFVYYINIDQLPFDLNMNTSIEFDLHQFIFLQNFETPMVILYNVKESNHIQRIEQHHFVIRHKIWPSVVHGNSSNTYLVNESTERFKYIRSLDLFLPKKEKWQGCYDYYVCNKSFTAQNYCEALKTLIHFEDLAVLRRYHSLIQHGVHLQRLEEGRASYTWHLMPEYESNILEPHDELLLVPSSEIAGNDLPHNTSKEWIRMLKNWEWDGNLDSSNNYNTVMCNGVIEKYKNGTIIFQLKQSNMPTFSGSYTMYFRPARYLIRHQLYAIELLRRKRVKIRNRIFFPTSSGAHEYSSILNIMNKISLHEVDQQLADDPEQMLAVKCILNGAGNIAPYIIFGPPGTGKTSTLIKAIYALYKQQDTSKILVMSNSNYVCDKIALCLIELLKCPSRKANAILRLYAHSYIHKRDAVNKLLLQYSNLENDHFYPKVEIIHAFRIVVCTLNVAGKLTLGNFGHDESFKPIYTHIIVDEAHSLTEAEVVMGLLCTLEKNTKLIIAGDPNQLNTHIRSECHSLGISFMERLLKLNVYEVDEMGDYNRDVMIRLCHNYRSHEQIVNILSNFYYEGKLKSIVDPDKVNIGTKWHRLSDSNFPIIFHSVYGHCIKKNNTSYSNADESLVVMEYLCDLLYYGINGDHISQKHIGIVTPYKEQCKVLKQMLYCRKLYDITCGTIEAYQGIEHEIILISFVRTELPTAISSQDKNDKKNKIGLGILKDPRRICTLISRAKSLMILIGDPRVLWHSPPLAHIITECKSNGNLLGTQFELPELEEVDLDVNADVNET